MVLDRLLAGRTLDFGERDEILRKVAFRPTPPQTRPPLTVVNEDRG